MLLSRGGRPSSRVIEVRGLAAFTPAGSGRNAVLEKEAAEPLTGDACESEWVRIARADLSATDPLLPNRKVLRLLSRSARWGLAAAAAALADAQVGEFPCASERLGVFANGLSDVEELCHLHSLLRELRVRGWPWQERFGELALSLLPPLMLLKRLPNATFCHVAQLAHARGYNATLLGGPGSGLDCLRQAARALRAGTLDGALVVACDSPLTWEMTSSLSRLVADAKGKGSRPVVIGEGSGALYLELAGRHPGRAGRPYAVALGGAGTQARLGLASLAQDCMPSRGLAAAVERAAARALGERDPSTVAYLDLSEVGIEWLDEAERAACRLVPDAAAGAATIRTGHLGNASGIVGLVRLCYLLSDRAGEATTAGLVVRASATGQCSAALLAAAA